MKEIMEILTEDITLKKALRLKEAKKGMQARFLRNKVLPFVIGMGILLLVMFSVITVSDIAHEERTLEEIRDELPRIGVCMMFLIVGGVFALMIYETDEETLVSNAICPVIDSALEELAEEPKSSDNETETGIETN